MSDLIFHRSTSCMPATIRVTPESGFGEAIPDCVPCEVDTIAHPSFSKMFARWRSTVLTLITSVTGTIMAAERIDDGTAVNLGTMERTRAIDAVHEVMDYTGHEAQIESRPDLPTGSMNRVADTTRSPAPCDEVRRTLDGGALIDRRVEPIGGAR